MTEREERKKRENELRNELQVWLDKNKVKGERIEIDTSFGYPRVEILCDGECTYTAYLCCLEPHHSGKCYSDNKKVNFERTN